MKINKLAARRFSSFYRVLLIILCLFGLASTGSAKSFKEAEETAQRYAKALNQFDVTNMVNELHSDIHNYFYMLCVHIMETTDSASEKEEMFKMYGVKNSDEFKRLSPKTMTERCFDEAFSNYVTKPARNASLNSKITIVGTLNEKNIVYVLYRTEMNVKGKEWEAQFDIPSLVALKQEDGRYKVVNTTQLAEMMAKLNPIFVKK